MHVTSTTALTADQLDFRFRQLAEGALIYTADREVPKFFLRRSPITPPAAAEVQVITPSAQTEVVLRLMWGALPAPFPRAVAAAGMLLAIGLLALAGVSALTAMLAVLLAGAPIAALFYQRLGEARLQEQLQQLIEGSQFVHKPH